LIVLNAFPQFIIADLELRDLGAELRVFDPCDLPVSPLLQRLGSRGVVTMHIDDQWFLVTHGENPFASKQ